MSTSLLFGGSNTTYVTIPYNPIMNIGTGDFTVEWFQYQTDANAYPQIYQRGSGSNLPFGCSIGNGNITVWIASTAYSITALSNYKNKWLHFAVCRASGTVRVFQDGTQIGSNLSNNVSISSAGGDLTIGNYHPYYTYAGFGGNMYGPIWENTAKYTSNFTVPRTFIISDTTYLFLTGDNIYGKLAVGSVKTGVSSSLSVPYSITISISGENITQTAVSNLTINSTDTLTINGGIGIGGNVNISGNLVKSTLVSVGNGWIGQASYPSVKRGWNAVAWSPTLGLFAAVTSKTESQQAMISRDGINWTLQTTPTPTSVGWNSICWSPKWNIFLSVGIGPSTWDKLVMVGNVISGSSDLSWSFIPSAVAQDAIWKGVCWSSTLEIFCAVGYVGKIMTSPDGITWKLQSSTVTTPLYTVSWIEQLGIFVAAGDNTYQKLITSPDGITWTQRDTPSTISTSVTWSQFEWGSSPINLIVGVGGSGNIITSTNGSDWTSRTSQTTQYISGVKWSPEMQIFKGVAGNGVSLTSTNGIDWATETGVNSSWTELEYSPQLRMFCAVANTNLTGETYSIMIYSPGYTRSDPISYISSAKFATSNKSNFADGYNQGYAQQFSTELILSSPGNKVAIATNNTLTVDSRTQLTAYTGRHKIDPIDIHTYVNGGWDIVKQTLSLQNSGLSLIGVNSSDGNANILSHNIGTLAKGTQIRGLFTYIDRNLSTGCQMGIYKTSSTGGYLGNWIYADVSNTGIAFLYRFDDISGTNFANTASGTAVYDASAVNGASVNTTDYKIGIGALNLVKASSQYVQLPPFTNTTNGITISCWYKPLVSSPAQYARVFDFGNGSDGNNILYCPMDGPYVQGTFLGIATNKTTVGQWYHFVWTIPYAASENVTHTIYVNGVLSTASGPSPIIITRSNNYIGKSNWPEDPYIDMIVDDFRVYNRVLSAAEIDALYTPYNGTYIQGSYLRGVCWGNNKFVAVGYSGGGTSRIAYSTTGQSWTVASTAANEWYGVSYSPTLNRFCSVGNGIYGTSSDGITWTLGSHSAGNLTRVVWASGLNLFVAVCSGSSNNAATSPDGSTWTTRGTASRDWRGIAYSSTLNRLVAVSAIGDATNRVVTSSDGITWTAQTIPTSSNVAWQGVCWSEPLNLYVAVANKDIDYQNFASTVGLVLNGSPVPSIVNGTDLQLCSTVASQVGNAWSNFSTNYNRDFTVAFRMDVSNGGADPADGFSVQWNTSNAAAGRSGGYCATLANSACALKFSYYQADTLILLANDVTQQTINVSAQDTFYRYLYYWIDYKYSTGIFSVFVSTKDVKPSSATYTFTTAFTFTSTSYYIGMGAATGGALSQCLLKSFSLSIGQERIMTSSDGINWTSRGSPANYEWMSVAPAGKEINMLVAVAKSGSGNRIMRSTDGINWSLQSSTANNSWRDICWSPVNYTFVSVADVTTSTPNTMSTTYTPSSNTLVASTPANGSMSTGFNYIDLTNPYTVDETTTYYLSTYIKTSLLTQGISINHPYYTYGSSSSLPLSRMTQYVVVGSGVTSLPNSLSGYTLSNSNYNVLVGAYGNFGLNVDSTLIQYYPYENAVVGQELWNYRNYYIDGTIENSIVSQSTYDSSGVLRINSSVASITGSNNYSLSFDVSNQIARTPNTTDYPYTDKVTVECWVKSPSTNTGTHMIAGVEGRYGILIFNNVLTSFDWSSNIFITIGPNINTNTWTHVAVVFNHSPTSGSSYTYINGSLNTTFSYQIANIGNPFTIGAAPPTNRSVFTGKITEVRVWNTARTAAEIAAYYNKRIPALPGLQGYWRMDDGTGTTLTNVVTGNPTLTLINSPTWSTDIPTLTSYEFPKKIGTGILQLYRGVVNYSSYSVSNVNAYTVAAWVNVYSTGIISGPIRMFTVYSGTYYAGFQADDPSTNSVVNKYSVTSNAFGSASFSNASNTVPWFGFWTHLCMVVDNGTSYFYTNGILTTTSVFMPISGSTLSLTMGHSSNPTNYVQLTDDLRFYSRALSSYEVNRLYNYRTSIPSSILRAALLPTDGTISTWNNSTTYSGVNTTMYNSPTYNFTTGYTFNGTNQYGAIPSVTGVTDFDIGNNYSVEVWIRPEVSTISDGCFIEKWPISTPYRYPYVFRYNGANGANPYVSIAAWDGSNNPTISIPASTNTWHHIVGVFNFSGATKTITGYKNGVSISSTSSTTLGSVSNAFPAAIATRLTSLTPTPNSGLMFKGSVGLVRIYASALTQSQIQSLYNEYINQFV